MAYSVTAKIFHWGVAALFAYGIIKQVGDINQLEDIELLKFEIVFATTFLLILAIRFIYMRTTQTSALPEDTGLFQKFAARIVHLGMYSSLALIAISGLMIGLLYYSGYKDGLLNDALLGLHEFSVSFSYLLIIIHALAAIYHRLKKDGVWSAMVPFWRENI
ncbi:MAG: cytochrome b/b6 domain-containing protein [Alphaproteobacteria bacterium]|jgi:cytochrome b561|nr:cytochrome b/b6 domain-containing protein [Alphaproteobacteria bacterium]